MYFVIIIGLLLLTVWVGTLRVQHNGYTRGEFEEQLEKNEVAVVNICPNKDTPTGSLEVILKNGEERILYVTDVIEMETLVRSYGIDCSVESVPEESWFLNSVFPILIVVVVCVFFFVMMNGQNSGGGGGGRMMNFGKSRAKLTMGGENKITLGEVAGLKEEKEELQEIETYFKAHDIAYYFESNDGLYSSNSFKEFLKDTLYQGQIPEDSGFYALLKPLDECSYEGVNKLSFYSPNLPFETIVEHFEKQYDLVKSSWGEGVENTGELSLKGINKATAIKQLLAYLQIDLKDTYAIGDSMNDQEMFECVNTAIAMGNAMHGVKALADFITKDVLDDGLAYALDYFHLTD